MNEQDRVVEWAKDPAVRRMLMEDADLAVRQSAMADLYSEEAYVAAIARRNITWCRWREAVDLLAAARIADGGQRLVDLRPYIGALNEAQNDYEHAQRDLIKARVFWRAGLEQAA